MYLQIISKGEIDVKAFSILGNSTKRGDSGKIGMYGSGLKYGISALIRNEVPFQVFSGEEEIKFAKKPTQFRDKDFDIITINGKETSFTTDMGGKDWDKPFAPIREIYSNALDEDEDARLDEVEFPVSLKGYTIFYIRMTEAVRHFYENKEMYFCITNKNVLHSNDSGSIYPSVSSDLRLFRKGILCYSDASSRESPFNYNSAKLEINESRVLSSDYGAKLHVASIWKSCTDKGLIQRLLNLLQGANNGNYEHHLRWSRSWLEKSPKFTDTWEEIVNENEFACVEHLSVFTMNIPAKAYILPISLIDALREQFPQIKVHGYEEDSNHCSINRVQPTEELANRVIDAVALLQDTAYKSRWLGLKIEYVQFSNKKLIGLSKTGSILISEKMEDKSVEYVMGQLIKYNEESKYKDYDGEEQQEHLLHLLVSSLKRNTQRVDISGVDFSNLKTDKDD